MRRLLFFLFFAVIFGISNAQNVRLNQDYLNYIEKFSSLAVEKMKNYGIPASITLAQGLLESGAGKSRLAVEGNNHFGIKCRGDWKGATMTHDDDAKGECFRKYDSAKGSYDDHSIFLKSSKRYEGLFLLEINDYKGWAHGLSKAGYATDPNYPQRLIKLIEDYELHKYDTQTNRKQKVENRKSKTREIPEQKKLNSEKTETPKETAKTRKTENVKTRNNNSIGKVSPFTTHEIIFVNGTKAIKTVYGDSYAAIAEEFGLTEKEILKFNGLKKAVNLGVGATVYLEKTR